jgi:hypothetical protein
MGLMLGPAHVPGALSCTMTRVPGASFVEKTACQPSGKLGSVQEKRARASQGARFTHPWLFTEPNDACQKAPWSAYPALKY